MIVGFAAQDKERRIIGIDTAHNVNMTKNAVTKIAHNTATLIESKGGPQIKIINNAIEINADYSGPAYGLPSKQTIEAIRMVAETEGMITDPVYEGKSMAGLIDLCRTGFFPKNSKVLYVHLGGAPAIHAYHQAFQA